MIESIFNGFNKYFIDLSVGSFIPGSKSSKRKTTIFYDKTIFDDGEDILDVGDVPDALSTRNMSSIEIDATTDFNISLISNVVKVPTEDLGVFIRGVSNEPIRITMSGLVTNATENKIKTLKMIRDKKLPVRVFTYKFENSVLGEYKKVDNSNLKNFFYINNMFFKDTGKEKTTEITLNFVEIRTFDTIEEEFSFTEKKITENVGDITDSEFDTALSFTILEDLSNIFGYNKKR